MLEQSEITQKVFDYLYITYPRIACYCELPKIHKLEGPLPGCPIISGCNSPTDRISGLLDHFLAPLAPKLKSYIKDTTDLLNKISELPRLHDNATLVTLDVKSPYSNIDPLEAMQAIQQTLATHRDSHKIPSNTSLLCLLHLVLMCNNFEFNGRHFLQKLGIVMGTKSAPSIANLVMGNFENTNVYTYPKQPLVWYRFIDDIFMVWTHGRPELLKFLEHLNMAHPTLKFTCESSPI